MTSEHKALVARLLDDPDDIDSAAAAAIEALTASRDGWREHANAETARADAAEAKLAAVTAALETLIDEADALGEEANLNWANDAIKQARAALTTKGERDE